MNPLVLKLCGVFILTGVVSLYPNDMEFELENGRVLLLHEDKTWDMAVQSAPPPEDEITAELHDGSTIHISTDGTWEMYEKGIRGGGTGSGADEITQVYSTGTAQGPDEMDTRLSALEQAAEKLAVQIKKALGIRHISDDTLAECISSGAKTMDMDKNYLSKWKIGVDLKMDRKQIEAVIECAEEKMEKRTKKRKQE
ncbi:MAG: hypothetical protein ACOCSE_04030 [Chitinivibrionales bacterium]